MNCELMPFRSAPLLEKGELKTFFIEGIYWELKTFLSKIYVDKSNT
jgi:hypothetical protein